MAKPKCPPHDYRLTEERDGWITHTCRKCGDQIRRQQGRADRPGRAYAVAVLAMVALAAVLTACHVSADCPKGQTFTVLYYRSQVTEMPVGKVEVPVVRMVPVYGCRSTS